MNMKIVTTSDQSNTIYTSKFDEHYHSTFGALNESLHVYIETGLNHCQLNSIKVFEVGFGTGLNTILTYIESEKRKLNIEYTGIELYPIDSRMIKQLNYEELLSENQKKIFDQIHRCEWNKKIEITNNFTFQKINSDFNSYHFTEKYDLIYFDAFAPDKQPEMWDFENFTKIYNTLNSGGILTTYSSKGIVKKNLREAGFKVTRLNGPTGKRHILRAEKI